MPELQLGGKVIATQSGANNPVLASNVVMDNVNINNALASATFPFFLDNQIYKLSNLIRGNPVIAAWAVFDGTSDTGSNSPQTIEDQFNISSIVRAGTQAGQFTVNFSITMSSTSYLLTGHCEGSGYSSPWIQFDNAVAARTNNSCGIRTIDYTNNYRNAPRSGFIIVSEGWT